MGFLKYLSSEGLSCTGNGFKCSLMMKYKGDKTLKKVFARNCLKISCYIFEFNRVHGRIQLMNVLQSSE